MFQFGRVAIEIYFFLVTYETFLNLLSFLFIRATKISANNRKLLRLLLPNEDYDFSLA